METEASSKESRLDWSYAELAKKKAQQEEVVTEGELSTRSLQGRGATLLYGQEQKEKEVDMVGS